MNVYEVKIVSQKNSVICLLLWFAILTPLMILRIEYLPTPLGTYKAIAFSIPALALLYFLFEKLATAKTKWTVNKNEIVISWITQFSFDNASDIKIRWNKIESLNNKWMGNYERLKIKLSSGQSLIFYHDPLVWKDGFEDLILTMKRMKKEK